MIEIDGKNNFKNNTFDRWEWSAPVYREPKELRKAMTELNILGKTLKSVTFVGNCYDMAEDEIDEKVYRYYEEKGELEKLPSGEDYGWGRHYNLSELDQNILLCRHAQIDEPVILEFSDGSTFEIDYSDESCVRVSSNSIPIDIKPGIGQKSMDGNVLFSNILDCKITNIYIESGSHGFEYAGSCGFDLPEQDEYISQISLELLSKNPQRRFRLCFSNFLDYGKVWLTEWMKDSYITLGELRSGRLGPCFDEKSKFWAKERPIILDKADYEDFVLLLESKKGFNETEFFFDGEKDIHTLGYASGKYWLDHCDNPDSAIYDSAYEMVHAKQFGGLSIADKWSSFHISNYGSLGIEEAGLSSILIKPEEFFKLYCLHDAVIDYAVFSFENIRLHLKLCRFMQENWSEGESETEQACIWFKTDSDNQQFRDVDDTEILDAGINKDGEIEIGITLGSGDYRLLKFKTDQFRFVINEK